MRTIAGQSENKERDSMKEVIRNYPGARYLTALLCEVYGNQAAYGISSVRFEKRSMSFCDDEIYELEVFGSSNQIILRADYSIRKIEPIPAEIKARFKLNDALPLEQFYSLRTDAPELAAILVTNVIHQSKFDANKPLLIRLLKGMLLEGGIEILSPPTEGKLHGAETVDLTFIPDADTDGSRGLSFMDRDTTEMRTIQEATVGNDIQGFRVSFGLDRPSFDVICAKAQCWKIGDVHYVPTDMSYGTPFRLHSTEDRFVFDFYRGSSLDYCIIENRPVFHRFIPILKHARLEAQRHIEFRFGSEEERPSILLDLTAKELEIGMFEVARSVTGQWVRSQQAKPSHGQHAALG